MACRRKARVPEIQPADEDDDDTDGTLTPSQSGTPSIVADDWACDRTLQVRHMTMAKTRDEHEPSRFRGVWRLRYGGWYCAAIMVQQQAAGGEHSCAQMRRAMAASGLHRHSRRISHCNILPQC